MSVDPSHCRLNFAHDEEFVRLYHAHEARIFAYIVNLIPSRDDAEDVLQQTAIVLRQKFDQYDRSRDFAHWACGIAYRRALSHRRQQSRWKHFLSEAALERLARTHMAYSDLLEKRRLALSDCVAKLAPSDQKIVEHYYVQGRITTAKVAEELGRPANTILRALTRIRRTLRTCVERAIASEDRK